VMKRLRDTKASTFVSEKKTPNIIYLIYTSFNILH
jgi:hypothetical protein